MPLLQLDRETGIKTPPLTFLKVISKMTPSCNVILQQKEGQAIHACKRPQLLSTFTQCVAGTVLFLKKVYFAK